MTYAVTAMTSWADVAARILVFAGARGWGVAANVITNPVTSQTYTVTALTDGLTVTMDNKSISATTKEPRLNGTYPASYAAIAPTGLHQFGNNSPYAAPDSEPFLAFVIVFGATLFRHVYIGQIVKAGAYTNGDLLAANNHSTNVSGNVFFYDHGHQYMFRAYTTQTGANGGAVITHADNPTPNRVFTVSGASGTYSSVLNSLNGSGLFGGNGDGINDGLVYRASADFAASQILVPVNLYCANGSDGVNYRIRPLGHASGARLVDMKNLNPGQQVTIMSDTWRVFPEFQKRTEQFSPWPGTTFRTFETSYNFGLAYKET